MTIDRREEQQFNVKLAELLYAAFSQRDLATMVRLADEGIEVTVAKPAKNAGTYAGHKGFGQWYQSDDGHNLEVTEVVPVGPTRLVVVAPDAADLVEFRDSKVVGLHVFAGKDEALKVAKKRESESADG